MKKAAVLLSAVILVCTLCSCAAKDNTSETTEPNFDNASEILSHADSVKSNDSKATAEKDESKAELKSESKSESKIEQSKPAESKKEASSQSGKDDVIPSRSEEYEASVSTIVRPPEASDSASSETETDTDTQTDTDTAGSDTSSDAEAATDVPYLSGLWIVEKILDSDGNECDGRDIYGSVFNYAGVLDLDEKSEFELSIGIIPEGQTNVGVYEQRGEQLVLQYDDTNKSQQILDLKKIDGVEMLLLNVYTGGRNYTIYFSR